MSIFNLNFPFINNRVIITIHQFLTNPTGKKSSMMGKREEIRKNLEQRYNKLIKKHGLFKYKIYREKQCYYFHFKIPSETIDNLLYDVVLEFVPDSTDISNFKSIKEYSINFFSNSPHMMFTYTYVLKQGKITIEALESVNKYAKKALKDKPKVTNPIEIFGFEKTCYYACLFIDEHKLLEKDVIDKQLEKITDSSIKKFFDSIISQEDKFIEYNKKKIANKKEKTRKKVKKINAKEESNYKKAVKAREKRKSKSSFKPLVKNKSFGSMFKKK